MRFNRWIFWGPISSSNVYSDFAISWSNRKAKKLANIKRFFLSVSNYRCYNYFEGSQCLLIAMLVSSCFLHQRDQVFEKKKIRAHFLGHCDFWCFRLRKGRIPHQKVLRKSLELERRPRGRSRRWRSWVRSACESWKVFFKPLTC